MRLKIKSYGSLDNMLADATKQIEPKVGRGATRLMWTDRGAFTITQVAPTGKFFWMTPDIAERTDKNGMSESQTYAYRQDHTARPIRVSLRKDGRWKVSGKESCGSTVRIGVRDTYHDYSF